MKALPLIRRLTPCGARLRAAHANASTRTIDTQHGSAPRHVRVNTANSFGSQLTVAAASATACFELFIPSPGALDRWKPNPFSGDPAAYAFSDFSHTVNLSFEGPDGSVTRSASGLFPGTGTAVPEPAPMLLLLAAGLPWVMLRRRRDAVGFGSPRIDPGAA